MDSTSPAQLNPQERLALSRRAIVKHMSRNRLKTEDRIEGDFDESPSSGPASRGKLAMMKHAVQVWWHRHPASAALDLTRPLLSNYARSHPFKLLAISAGVGAATVVIRPWHMVGGVLLAVVKSSGVTNTLVSMVSSMVQPPEEHPGTRP